MGIADVSWEVIGGVRKHLRCSRSCRWMIAVARKDWIPASLHLGFGSGRKMAVVGRRDCIQALRLGGRWVIVAAHTD